MLRPFTRVLTACLLAVFCGQAFAQSYYPATLLPSPPGQCYPGQIRALNWVPMPPTALGYGAVWPMVAPPLVQTVYVPVNLVSLPTTQSEAGALGYAAAGGTAVQPPWTTVGAASGGEATNHAPAGMLACDASCTTQWYTGAEALWLARTRGQRVLLGEEQVVGGPIVQSLSTESFRFNPEPGFRVLLGRRLDDGLGAELSYFGLNHWDSSAALANTNPALNSLFSDFLALSGGIPDVYLAHYSADLHNAELGIRAMLLSGRASVVLLGGLRYVGLHEEFELAAASAVFQLSEQTRVTTNNHLVGAQVGGEIGAQLNNRWSLAALGKGGLFLNFADHHISNATTSAVVLDTSTAGNNLAAGLEAEFVVRCRLSDHCSLHAGYQLLFLTGLALAPEQLGSLNHDLVNVPPTVVPGVTGSFLDDHGSLLFHGPTVGFTVAW